jgi:predicted dienelactone hydrolase
VRRLVALAALALLVAPPAAASRGVGLRVVRFVDHARQVRYRTGAVRPRVLVTAVRYPLSGRAPFPLIVFAHGFAVAPLAYAALLDAWARAGYVVAAPTFPLESPTAPGGPDGSDLVHEPADIRFVITQLLRGPLRRLIDPHRIAVAGQSDGGVAALAVALDTGFRDPRIRAAVVLSGAQLAGARMAAVKPLLAVQGTADPINPPDDTRAFFALAGRPKFLLWLLGAVHLQPYTTEPGYRAVVARATIAFLDHYLRGRPLRPLLAAAQPGRAQLVAEP